MRIFVIIFTVLTFVPVNSSLVYSEVQPSIQDIVEEDKLAGELQWLQNETFVVTASKQLENINKSAASITVITDEEIRNMGARNLVDVLRIVPGIGVTQNNIGNFEIESRGIKTYFSEKVLFMLNSHPIDINLTNGGPTSWPKLTHLAVENIKRVEVIRGPGSALYGANAFSALINIITMDVDDIDGFELTAQGGSWGTQSYNLLFGKTFSDLEVSGNFNFFDTDGFRAYVESDNQTYFDTFGTNASTAPGFNDPREERYDAELRLGYKDLDFQFRYWGKDAGSYFGTADALNDNSKVRNNFYTADLKYTSEVSENLSLQIRVYHDFMSFNHFWEIFPEGFNFGGVFPEGYNILALGKLAKYGVDIQTTYSLTEINSFVLGLFGESQKQWDIENWTNYVPSTGLLLGDGRGLTDFSDTQNWNGNHERINLALYAEDIWDIRENFRLTSGVRYDHFSDTGGIFNPRAGFAWEFVEDYHLKVMYGKAFRAPTFAEQYNVNNSIWVGNPDLKPEKVETIEVSLGGDFTDRLHGSVTLFRSDVKDLIGFGPSNSIGTKTTENLYNVTSQGIELEAKTTFSQGSYIAANYTFQDISDSDTGIRTAEVPMHKGNIMANYRISDQFNFYADLFLKGSTVRDKDDTRRDAPGYSLVNTSFIAKNLFEKLEGLEFRISIYNLLNTDYQDPSPWSSSGYAPMPGDYPQPGRAFRIETRYKF